MTARHVKSMPLILHHNTVMLLHIYDHDESIDDWVRDMWLHENMPFSDMMVSSAKQMVEQLAPNACARFWHELSKAIHEHVKAQDAELGSNHAYPVKTQGD